jgi:Cu-Zn family superoxide dismutase
MKKFFLMVLAFFIATQAFASIRIPVYSTQYNKKFGTIRADDTIYGLLFTPNLKGLSPGIHGFHIHSMGFCNNMGMAAGGHLDPLRTNRHDGPYQGTGHLGDLPVLIVDKNGKATLPVLAPRLKLSTIKGKALMIHAGSDNYSDVPQKLGGGGERIACGEVPYH